MLKSKTKILITGGGSGGHISVAKSLIDALINDYDFSLENIIYVGGDLGMENEKPGNSLEQKQFKDSKFKTYFIRAGKLQRSISLKSISLLFRSILGFFDSFTILRNVKPDLIISSGGFVSVPVCFIGWILKIPIYLHEQTASVGLSNKIVGRFARKVFVAFKGSIKYFSEGKSIHVGNVVRKEILDGKLTSDVDRDIVGLMVTNKDLPFVYISGGSLGSHSINTKVLSSLNSLLRKYKVLLQTGDNEIFKDFDKAIEQKDKLTKDLQERLVIKKYIQSDSIGYVLNNMDMFVGRAGANTVYEIGVLKKNALFIPIPWVTHNEQYLNAKVLNEVGTSNILEEKYLESANLTDEIERLQEQLKHRAIDEKKLESLFPTNATYSILEYILKEN